MKPKACDYSEYHQNSRHLNFHQVQDVKDKANQLHGINKYIQRPGPNGLMRREKRSVQPDAVAVENQLVELAYRPGRSIKSACMGSSYAPKNMQSRNPGHRSKFHREATATIESHLMLDSKFTKTPAGVISFLPAQTQKRPFSSASQTREGTNSNKTSRLKISAGAGAQSRSRHSRQLFQGLKYGQAASMSCSLKQSQALNNYKNTITDFGGLTLLERQRNFKDYNPFDQSKEQLHEASRNYLAITEPVEADYQCSANYIRIASSTNNRVMFPSQFASAKSGLMGFEERSVGIRQAGAVKILQGESKSEVGEHREPVPAGSLWHTRMFSKTRVYLNEAENCTDGITLPISYFDLMPKKEIETMLELYEMRQKKNNDASSSTGLLVSVNTIPTHFNIDSNKLHKNLKNNLIDQLTNQNHCCEGESNSILKRWTTLVHVSKIDFSRSSDDDTVTLPEWVFPSLQIQIGEPVVVSLDRQLTDLQSILNDKYLLKYIQLEPLQTNYLEMGMQDKRNQECDKSIKDETKDAEQSRYKDSQDSIKLGIQQALKSYRILRPDRVLKFFTNNKTYEFQIRGLNDDQHAFYINSQNHKLEIELIVNDLLTQTPGKNASFARGNSMSTKTKRGSNRHEKQQSAGIDLDLILQERGLDIFYMDEVVNECRGLSHSPLQKQEERKETMETAKPGLSKPQDMGSSERAEIHVGPEVTLKTTAKTGAKLKNMLHDIDSSDQSNRDPASPSSPKTKSNEDLRLRLLQSQPNSTPRIRENHSDDANTPSRPSRRSKGIAKAQANTFTDLAKNPHQPSEKGLLTSPDLSPEIQSPAPMRGSKNFTDGIELQYGRLAKDQALDGHVLVTDQENSTNRTKTQGLRQPGEQNEPNAIQKATEDHMVQRTKPLDSFPELLRKKEKSIHEHNKVNNQILDQNNLRSPTKEKQKIDILGCRSILSDGPSFNRLVLNKQAAAQGESKDKATGLGQFEDFLLKQQFKEKFENIDQAQLRTRLSLAGENDEEKCELSASSQGQAALLETAMLPALPADGEVEAMRDSGPDSKAASPHRRREHRASLATPQRAVKVRQQDTKAQLAVGAPFGKDNICLKVNNMEVIDGLQQSAHAKVPVEKHNTELKTSFQTLGDVLNSAAFGRRKASEGSVTDFLTQTISKEKEAAKRAAPSGMPASRAAAVGRSHESEQQFQTIIRNPTDFASTPNGDFSVFVVPKDFRIKAMKKVAAAKPATPLRKIPTAEHPTMGEEMEALRASSNLEGGVVALDESVMRKWASGSRSLYGQSFLRAQQHRSQKIGTLHNYEHNEASKRIETSLFTCGGMQPLFSPTLAISEAQTKKPEGEIQLAPTVYAAIAPEAEFTPGEKKMFQDLHEMILQEQYSRSQESVLGQNDHPNHIFSQAKQAAEAYNRDIETFGHVGEEGTQDLIKQAGEESEVPSLKPSPSLKTHERTQRRLEEAGPATHDKGSNKVTDCSEITARHKPGSPDSAEIDGDQSKSGLPTPTSGGKLGAEIELKAEVTVKPKNADLNVNANAPLTPGSERSKNSISAIGQVIFSKKHVHGSPKRGTPDKRQGRATSGNTAAEKGPTTPGRQANRHGDPRFRSPDRPQGFNQRTFQLQMGGSGHDWDGLATTQKLVKKVSTKTRIDVPNADLSSALKQSEPISPATQLLPASRPSEKKDQDEELVDDASQDGNGNEQPKLTGAAALASTKYKIELRPANWKQITQSIKEKAKRYRRVGAPQSNWESIKANFAKLQGGQTSETQKYSVYGSNLEASQRTAVVKPGLPNTARSIRQRARGLKTLCAGEINEYNHHSASIPQGCKGVGKARHARARSKNSSSQAAGRGAGGNLNRGFSFLSQAEPVSGVRIALIRAYPHSLLRNELQGGLSPGGQYYENHDLLRLNHDYGLWEQQEAAQPADTGAGSAQRAGDLETHMGPAQPRWSGHSRGAKVEAQANILSNQTLGLAYQMGDSQLEQRSQ